METDPEKKEQMMEFMENLNMLKDMKVDVFGNMSCVMQTIGFWDKDNMPVKDTYKVDMFELMPGIDETLKEYLQMKGDVCEKFVLALPEPEGDVAPFKKMFGKGIMMHNCMLVRIYTLTLHTGMSRNIYPLAAVQVILRLLFAALFISGNKLCKS